MRGVIAMDKDITRINKSEWFCGSSLVSTPMPSSTNANSLPCTRVDAKLRDVELLNLEIFPTKNNEKNFYSTHI